MHGPQESMMYKNPVHHSRKSGAICTGANQTVQPMNRSLVIKIADGKILVFRQFIISLMISMDLMRRFIRFLERVQGEINVIIIVR
jgi:hypothetical protein